MSVLKPVANYGSRFEAEMAKSILASEGIPSMVSGGDAGGTNPGLLTGSGGVNLMVPEEDLERARQLLENTAPDQ